jgi:GAF domain-containing protein
LLELVVQIAARVIGAASASMLLLDRSTQQLVFTVAFPDRVADLEALRVPLGEGIAGLVALTGQPMAISDARSDPRHAAEIAEQTGYRPDSLLCTPLVFGGQVVGVLELMDKQDATGFDNTDIETVGLFAQLAAVAIEQSRTRNTLASLLLEASPANQEPGFERTLELARLVHDVGQAGDAELEACTQILRAFAGYLQTKAQPWQA